MGTMSISVNPDITSLVTFSVTNEQANGCATLWTLTSTNAISISDTVHVSASEGIGSYILSSNDPSYLYNINYVTTVKNIWTLRIENSGLAGVYNQQTITITNVTTGATTAVEFMRHNDGGIC